MQSSLKRMKKRGVKKMKETHGPKKSRRHGFTERWKKRSQKNVEQKGGEARRVQGRERKEKKVAVRRDKKYRYGERRKSWKQQYGTYEKQKMRGRALGTIMGRNWRHRREDEVKRWEKRDRGRRKATQTKSPIILTGGDEEKRKERQQKRIWNVQMRRRKERGSTPKEEKKWSTGKKSKDSGKKGRHRIERKERRKGEERRETQRIRRNELKEKKRILNYEGKRKKRKVKGGERVI